MLVVTANWEISDGTLWPSAAGGVVARFIAALTQAAVRGGWRHDGSYAPLDRVDVVLAGDTFDWLASQAWLGPVRPWQRGSRQRTIHGQVVEAALRRGRRCLTPLLRTLHRGIRVPQADRRGRPVVGPSTVVPVGVTLLAGNLDKPPRCQWPRSLASRLGFGVGHAWSADGIVIRHGHGHDPLWAGQSISGDDPEPCLGEVFRVDLLGRFAARPEVAALAGAERRRFLAELKGEHPLAAAATVGRWLALLGGAMAVRDAWLASVEAWHRSARATGVRLDAPFDVIDALASRLTALDDARPDRRRQLGVGGCDPLADVLLPCPHPADEQGPTIVLGHPPESHSSPPRSGRMVCLGGEPSSRRSEGAEGGWRVRQIAPPPAVADPLALMFSRRDPAPWRTQLLGGPVSEWEPRHRTPGSSGWEDGGAWIIDAA